MIFETSSFRSFLKITTRVLLLNLPSMSGFENSLEFDDLLLSKTLFFVLGFCLVVSS